MKVIFKKLKKGALLTLALCILVSATGILGAALAQEGNLVVNGGFEDTSTRPADYGVGATATFSGSEHYSGTKSLKVVKNEKGGNAIVAFVPVSDENYEFSAWVRLSGDELNAKSFSAYYINDGKREFIGHTQAITGEDGWVQIKAVFFSGSVPAGGCSIGISVDDHLAGTVYYIDDVVVKGVSAPKIVSSTPQNGAANVPVDTNVISVEFDAEIDPATINSENVYFESHPGLAYSVAPSGANTCTINLAALSAGSVYSVVLKNIKGADGSVMPRRAVSFSAASVASNVIPNPNFESDDLSHLSGYRMTWVITDEFSREEDGRSLKLTANQENAEYASVSFRVTSGTARSFKFSIWYRADVDHPYVEDHKLFLTYNHENDGGAAAGITMSDVFKNDGNWYEFSGTFTLPSTIANVTRFSLIDNGSVEPGKGGIVYIDSMVFEPLVPATLTYPPTGDVTNIGVNEPLVLTMSQGVENPGVTVNGSTALISKTVAVPGTGNKMHYVYFKGALEYDTQYTVNVAAPAAALTLQTPKRLSVDSLTPESGVPSAPGALVVKASGISNNTLQDLPLTIAALLFKDGKLIDMKTAATSVPALANVSELSTTINVPDMSDGEYSLKVFAFDSFAGLQNVK